ncbi:MAG: T9SS type A sorting domain-containing protein [Bacteroidales bacterium]|nr:T9SS type A sorting domain-containing protein [Bacteroidales bacterium]MCF8458508.1 T9SS type A sorting domain-containing protein [Bacteroidales bacterium]
MNKMMPFLVLILNLFLIGNITSQVQSSCCVTPELYNAYHTDVLELTIEYFLNNNLPEINQIEIPQSYQDTIMHGLAAVFNAYSIPERDSVFDIYCIHNNSGYTTHLFHTISIKPDLNYYWANWWANGQTTTYYPPVDNLLSTYGFNLTYYYNSIDVASFYTSQSINVYPLCDSLETIPWIIYAEPGGFIGDDNRIIYNRIGNDLFYSFSVRWGDCMAGCFNHRTWSFKVDADYCMVNYIGMTESNYNNSPLPYASNCNITIPFTPSVDSISEQICQGQGYSFGNDTLYSTGMYVDTFLNSMGCDSIVNLDLVVEPVYLTTISATICQNHSYYFNGQYLYQAGTYVQAFQMPSGCDSLVQLELMLDPAYAIAETQNICQGESYDFFGQILTSPGLYSHSFTTSHGCDSSYYLTLIVNPSYEVYETAVICDSTPYNFYGQIISQPGNYSTILQTQSNCDSTVYLTLAAGQGFEMYDTAEICEGEMYVFGNGTYFTSGDHSYVFQSISACDSIVFLHLIVHPNPQISFYPYPDSVFIDAGVITLPLANPPGGQYSGLGVSGNSFNPLVAGFGVHQIYFSYTDIVSACTSIESISITVVGYGNITETDKMKGVVLYPNPANTEIWVRNSNPDKKNSIIEIINIKGEVLFSEKLPLCLMKFDISALPVGSYFFRIPGQSQKFVKIR